MKAMRGPTTTLSWVGKLHSSYETFLVAVIELSAVHLVKKRQARSYSTLLEWCNRVRRKLRCCSPEDCRCRCKIHRPKCKSSSLRRSACTTPDRERESAESETDENSSTGGTYGAAGQLSDRFSRHGQPGKKGLNDFSTKSKASQPKRGWQPWVLNSFSSGDTASFITGVQIAPTRRKQPSKRARSAIKPNIHGMTWASDSGRVTVNPLPQLVPCNVK